MKSRRLVGIWLLASMGWGIAQKSRAMVNFEDRTPSFNPISPYSKTPELSQRVKSNILSARADRFAVADVFIPGTKLLSLKNSHTFYSVYSSSLSPIKVHNNPNIGIIGAEFLGATVGAAVMSIFTGILPGYIYDITHPFQVQPSFGLAIALIGGYCLGFPLGSALGTYYTGRLFHQNGTLWGSLVGGTIGMAIGMSAVLLQPYGLILTFTLPQIGSIVGYNLSRKSSNDTHQQGCIFGLPESEISSKSSRVKIMLLSVKF